MKFVVAGADWRLPVVLGLVCLIVALSGPEASAWLQFDREALARGQWWRLLSGHLVHLGWPHLWLNLAGLALVWLLVGSRLAAAHWLLTVAISFVGVGCGLWVLDPDLQWYVGLSGALHGMLTAGLVMGVAAGSCEAIAVAAGVVAKLAYEQLVGPLPGSESAAGGAVVVNAHLYGFVSGGLAGLLIRRKVQVTARKN